MIELEGDVAAATAAGCRVHWLIEGGSGQRGISCEDVDAVSVVVRIKDAENPKRSPSVFRISCDAAETALPVSFGKHLLAAQLWASTGGVLSSTREEPVDVTDAGSSLTLLFEVADGWSIRATR